MIEEVVPLDREHVMVCASGGTALLPMRGGDLLWRIDSPAQCGALSPNGTLLALGETERIGLWNTRTKRLLKRFEGHVENVTSVAFSPNAQFVVSGGRDGTVRLWEVASGREVRQLRGWLRHHTASVESVAFSPNGQFVVSGSGDKTVRLWEVSSGRAVRSLGMHAASAKSIAYSADGKLVVSGSEDKTVRLWETQRVRAVRRMGGWL